MIRTGWFNMNELQNDPVSVAGLKTGRPTLIAGLAAIGSTLAASSCCLPLVPFLMAAGIAGSSAFLTAAKPYFLGLAIFFIAFGFYQSRKARECHRPHNMTATALLWLSSVIVLLSILFPQLLANLAAGVPAR